jgi:hypothetical protein
MLDLFKKIHPTFGRIEECEIKDQEGKEIGWHSVAFDYSDFPICGGTRPSREEARRVAVAEGLERGNVHYL